MLSFASLLLAATAAVAAAVSIGAVPNDIAISGAPSGSGTSNGFYYGWSTGGSCNGTVTIIAPGECRITWGDCGQFVGGIGWNPGSTS